MRNSISTLVQKITKASTAFGLAIALSGGTAFAAGRTIEAGMNQGLDYVAAHDAADRTQSLVAPRELVAEARSTELAIQQGKDYVDAHAPARSVYDAQLAREAQQVQSRIDAGQDYVAAHVVTVEVARPTQLAGTARSMK